MTIIYFVYNCINILHQNINGIINKSDQLIVCLDELRNSGTEVDILCITEHNMIGGDEYSLYIPNFRLAASYMRQNRHGGSCILVRNTHKFKSINDIHTISLEGIVEFSAIELTEHQIYVICVYRAPKTNSQPLTIFWEKLHYMLSKHFHNKKQVVLCGDFNIDTLKNDKFSREFKSILSSFNLSLELQEPTRLVSKTCIDNFAHNLKDCKNQIIELGLSDHTAQILTCPIKRTCKFKYWYIFRRDCCKENMKKFQDNLQQLTFYDVYNNENPDAAFNTFYHWFKLLYDLCFPQKKIKIKSEVKPKWITRGIKTCSKRNRELLWLYRISPNNTNRISFKAYNKRYRLVIKQTKMSQNIYYINNASNKTKATWNIINNKKNRCPTETIPTLKVNGKIIIDPQEICNEFNNYYIDVAKAENILNNKQYNIDLTYKISNSIFIPPTIPHDIHKIIISLKNTHSPGHDGIITKVIKNCSEIISPVMSHVINLCIVKGVFPDQLKTAVIKPLFKKGDKSDISNYRPIALLPVFSKIFEKVIYKSLLTFLETHKILTPHQFGFRKNKSINMAIYNFLTVVMSKIDHKIPTTALFIDLTKAFDHVDHNILLSRLYDYGIRGNVYDLLKSYLSDRLQYTQLNHVCPKTKCNLTYESEHKAIKYGVPQGSVLGPLLFLIYINPLPQVINHPMTLFADDSTVLFYSKNINNLESDINSSLVCLIEWLESNNLKINLEKTKIMNFRQRKNVAQNLNINYLGHIIEETETAKFLGLYLDCNVKWKAHIDFICKKINKISYALRMLKKTVPQKTVLTAYHACVSSILRYGIIFWGNSVDKEFVFKAQKNCIRSICNIRPWDSCKIYFKNLKILTLPCLYILECSIFVKCNIHLFEFKTRARRTDKLCTVMSKTHLYKQSIFVKAPVIYNKLPATIRATVEVDLFKRRLHNFLIDKCYYTINDFLIDESFH